MIGNALPPPVAKAVGTQIHKLLYNEKRTDINCQEGISQKAAV